MLLAIDIGNTNIVISIIHLEGRQSGATCTTQHTPHEVLACWRINTTPPQTEDEYYATLSVLMARERIDPQTVDACLISSVVPGLNQTFQFLLRTFFHLEPLFVTVDITLGIAIETDHPREVGADLLVGAVAAAARFPGSDVLVLDCGTATTLIHVRGARAATPPALCGALIAPGLRVMSEALSTRTAKLPRIGLDWPRTALGKNTVDAMQGGMMFGYAGLVKNLIAEMRQHLARIAPNQPTKVIGTGGTLPLIAAQIAELDAVDDHLLLDGLALLYERNQERIPRR